MPITIISQNWDSLTPPALPSGWTFDGHGGTWATSASAPSGSLSGGNALKVSSGGGAPVAFPTTADSNNGNVRVRASFIWPLASAGNVFWYLFARGHNPDPDTGASFYAVEVAWQYDPYANSETLTVTLLSGLSTQLGTVSGTTTPTGAGTWYLPQLVCFGNAISANVQRLTDSKWLQANGSWASSFASCLSATDSSVTGSGYAGFYQFASSGGGVGDFYTDDFLFESLAGFPATPAVGPVVRRRKPPTKQTLLSTPYVTPPPTGLRITTTVAPIIRHRKRGLPAVQARSPYVTPPPTGIRIPAPIVVGVPLECYRDRD